MSRPQSSYERLYKDAELPQNLRHSLTARRLCETEAIAVQMCYCYSIIIKCNLNASWHRGSYINDIMTFASEGLFTDIQSTFMLMFFHLAYSQLISTSYLRDDCSHD